MRKLITVCLLVAGPGLVSLSEAAQSCGDLAAPQDMATVTSPADVPGVYLARVNAGNAEQVSNLFATDAVFRGAAGQVLKGRAAIREMYEGLLSSARPHLAVGRAVADDNRVAFELISLQGPCNDDDPATAVDMMDINDQGQIQAFTVFLRPRPE